MNKMVLAHFQGLTPPDLIHDHIILSGFTIAVLGLAAWCIFTQAFLTDLPVIRGIPEAPGAVAFYGHLKVLGLDHPSQFEKWGTKRSWPVLQARFGRRRVVVLNGFKEAQEWIVKNATATIDRPLFWTFHNVVSKSQGSTIGTSPWNESAKRRRTAVSAYLTRPALRSSAPMLDVESHAFVEDLFKATQQDNLGDVDPRMYCLRLAFNITLMICYGTRFKDIHDPDLLSMLDITSTVASFRSTNSNPQDYVPLLRYLPNKRQKIAVETREKRDIWLANMFSRVQSALDKGQYCPCITGTLLSESGSGKLDESDIKSINVSLVSGGFETVSTTMLAGLGWLASDEGQVYQEKVFNDLIIVYGDVETAWDKVVIEERSDVTVALYKEMLRYFAAIQLLPPRQTMKDFEWNGITIPKGVSVYMNAQAINHDHSYYGEDAHIFRPERWLDEKRPIGPPYQFSFGAGSRACPAIAITNRLLYLAFSRLLLHFKVLPAADGSILDAHYIRYNSDTTQQTCHPKPFRIRLEPRQLGNSAMEKCFASSRANGERMIYN
ncbi:phenylacetate 2-hydroxylase [Hypoxylon rubiginosum]|uniref:Phenylacetate 2-hydroxylase n=1 Tax=Hypoxylon rubiginosum TaxID=110542 RepID=A0ACC0DEE0_9PEZI|nr:phenylacetate 2-hydroxylase [Hypoxylon rubiginosum]